MTATPSALPGNEDSTSEVRGEGTAGVSAARGWWSVGLALGAFVLYWVLGFTISWIAIGTQSWKDPTENAQYEAAVIVLQVLLGAMLLVALVLGITSIVRASRHRERTGKATAIVLGSIGTVLCIPMGLYLLLPYIP
jgi:hypothetical protein